MLPTSPPGMRLQQRAKARGALEGHVSLRAYLDTPDFDYVTWLKAVGENEQGLHSSGTLRGGRVAIIGAGASGAVAAYELQRAGCQVSVFDAEPSIGGRCDSTKFPDHPSSKNLVELGAMRFPASEFILQHYLEKFGIAPNGIAALPTFPDPGRVPTWVCFQDTNYLWTPAEANAKAAAPGFQTVYQGWNELVAGDGIWRNGKQVCQGVATIQKALTPTDDDYSVANATKWWQEYLDLFGSMTFYGVLYQLFTGQNGFTIPGGEPWTFEDFDKFGTLGVGSGGFGALYPINFPEIWRLIINGLEDTQYFIQGGIRQLPDELLTKAQKLGTELTLNFQVTEIQRGEAGDLKLVGFDPRDGKNTAKKSASKAFDRVIVATTTRSMEVSTNLTYEQYLNNDVASAVRRVHMVASIKVAARIKKFWKDNSCAARVLLADNLVRQVYTLDYDDEDTAVCFITYSWDDDAVKQQGMGISLTSEGYCIDKVKLYSALLDDLKKSPYAKPNADCPNADVASFVSNLEPIPPNDPKAIQFVEWQSKPTYNGAFKLSEPGQDEYVRRLYFDYQKVDGPSEDDSGVYLAGDCLAWTSGWVEGALQTGLNAACAVVKSLGGAVTSLPAGRAPGSAANPLCINPTRFKYFNPQPPPAAAAAAAATPESEGPRKRPRVEFSGSADDAAA